MKKPNPYAAKPVISRNEIASHDLRFNGTAAIGHNGELNAYDRQQLGHQIASLMNVASSNIIVTPDLEQKRKNRQAALAAIMVDNKTHAEVGAALADELYLAGKRDGFMRRVMARQEVAKGTIPMIWMRMKNVVAIIASDASMIEAELIRDNKLYPPEFYIEARPFVEQRDIEQSATDVLEEKYIESLEALMVAEDRLWYKMATSTINIANPFTNISGTLTASALANQRTLVNRWNIPAANLLIASDLWNDIIGDPSFAGIIDPVSKHELLLTGQLGQIYGMTIYTDGFRHPQHKVFNQGDIFVVGDAINHGAYTDRGGINSQPIDGTQEKKPGRGWFMTELMSMELANARSVSKANRS